MNENLLGFECVLSREDHAKIVMDWRNDSEALRASFHQSPKLWDGFWQEFRHQYFTIPELPPLFVLAEGQRVAFLRFRPQRHPSDVTKRCCELSIMVAPAWRGKGVASAALKALQPLVASRGYEAIYAEVKVGNVASEKAFSSAGFTRISQGVKHVDDKEFFIGHYLLSLAPDKYSQGNVFIVAEAGSNWRVGSPKRDMAMAKALIDVGASAGADAVKFQVFRADSVYVKNAGQSDYLADADIKEDIHGIFEDLSMPYEMIPELADYCKHAGVQFMASPFSKADFDAIDPYVSVHKVASYEISHLRLLEHVARSGKPTILSTGAADEDDIRWAVDTFFANKGIALTLLQCTAKYPAGPESMNLSAIPHLKARFGVPAGLSDHSRDPVLAPVAAVALGARVIEKHFTLNNNLPGPDHIFAVTPKELKRMVKAIRVAEVMRGTGEKVVLPAEEELRSFARRGIQAIRPIASGEELREGVNIDILRPGKQLPGVHPKHISAIEGKCAKKNIAVGSGIQFIDI